jgi:hypothetical protein
MTWTGMAIYVAVLFGLLVFIIPDWDEEPDFEEVFLLVGAVAWPITLPLALLCAAAWGTRWCFLKLFTAG